MQGLTDREFQQFQRFIFDAAGITLSDAKKALVTGRLAKRLQHHSVASYGDYFKLLSSGQAPQEVQIAVDLLTTNETYFFREPRHFELLREQALLSNSHSKPFRIWSAAASSGEEAFSIAMVLEDVRAGRPWEVLATDISTRVLDKARTGHYPMVRARGIPPDYLRRFCLKGEGSQDGTLLVSRTLRQKVSFLHANLNAALPNLGLFDIIFLRNVLIYFNMQTKRSVVERVLSALKPDGFLLIGHSESLHDVTDAVYSVAPSIYRKASASASG